jgi:hypothetical protein
MLSEAPRRYGELVHRTDHAEKLRPGKTGLLADALHLIIGEADRGSHSGQMVADGVFVNQNGGPDGLRYRDLRIDNAALFL